MRAPWLLALAITGAACTVSDKIPALDGGSEADADPGPDDLRPPQTTITASPELDSRDTSPSFEFEADEPAHFQCSVDAQPPVDCASPYTRTLADGAHVFAVRAIDDDGNADDTPAERGWTIDTIAPSTTLTETPPAADNSPTVQFEFTGNEDHLEFGCALDGGTYHSCDSGDSFGPLADGAHSFAVRAVDRAGNLEASPAIHAWAIDSSTPDTVIIAGPSGPITTGAASFTFMSPDAGSGATFQCALDGAAFSPCNSPISYDQLGDANHTFAVRVRDAVGNLDPTPATRSFTVDTTAPVVSFVAGPGEGTTSGPYVVLGFSHGTSTVACSRDGAAFAPCTSPLTFSLPAGAHSLAVRATDDAGNVTIATRSWTVACAAPVDEPGVAGLFHLDEPADTQSVANGAAAAIAAVLGDDDTVEPDDPAAQATGRFGGALTFTAADADHLTWSPALGAIDALTIELWARPDAGAGSRDLVVSADGRLALRLTATRRLAFTITGPGGGVTALSAPVSPDAWHHVIASLDAPAMRLWVDGVAVELGGVDTTGVIVDQIRVGGDVPAYGGELDELVVAETALTSDAEALPRYCPL